MRLQDLNWMDVERYLERDNRILLITGATEQHAYLSLLTDILIPSRIALAVAERVGILIAPPLNFGVSSDFIDFPGTISLSKATFEIVLMDMIESLMLQGFGRFFVLNGHGGNQIPARLADLHTEGVARVAWHDWWRGAAVKAFEAQHGILLDHANWGENFPFNRVSDSPRAVKALVNLDLLGVQSAREVLGDGSYGGPYQVDDALMNDLFERVVDETVSLVSALGSG
jgi:creatinine amidohydrolase